MLKNIKSQIWLLFFCLFIFPEGLARAQSIEGSLVAEHCASLLNIPLTDLQVKRFAAGVSNHVYEILIPNNKKYVAKLFTKKSIEEVQDIDHHVSGLRSLGFRIPQTISISYFNNRFPLQLLEWEEGSHITDTDLPEVAYLMARFHIQGSNLHPAPKEKFKQDAHFQALFKKAEEWSCVQDLKNIYEKMDVSYLSQLPTGVIHGDFSYSNIIKTPDLKLTLIDFDHICSSFLLTDLVRCQMFYGFDSDGLLLEDKVKRFTSNYNAVRPLEQVEKENFYTHMKLMMIDTALEMYNHMYVIGDLPSQVIEDKTNNMLNPELLVKKIKSLEEKKSIDFCHIEQPAKIPVIFFGLSGVGKTTLIKRLTLKFPGRFYIPVFTCTRSPRPDDDPHEFEYITVDEFLELDRENAFFLKMHEGSRYYGYRKMSLWDATRIPLLNCSPCGIDNARAIQALLVLIQGDWKRGLLNRHQSDEQQERTQINERLFREFYSKDWFLRSMDIVLWNDWEQTEQIIAKLNAHIIEGAKEVESESVFGKAA